MYFPVVLLLSCLFALSCTTASANQNGFSWPISCVPGVDCSGTHFRIGYPDVSGTGLSFACKSPGYIGHQGTDIVVSSIDQGIKALAAADGVVRWSADGLYDRCPNDSERTCDEQNKSGLGSGATLGFNAGNFAVIEHTIDGVQLLTLYAHLRKDSLSVSPGQKVVRGQVVGGVGSSGNSMIPHLHFGVYKAEGVMYRPVDPWKGSCNTSSDGLWAFAVPYRSDDLQAQHTQPGNANDPPSVYMQSTQHSLPKKKFN